MTDQPPARSDAPTPSGTEAHYPQGTDPLLLYAEGVRRQQTQRTDVSPTNLSTAQSNTQVDALRTRLDTWMDHSLADLHLPNDQRSQMLNDFKSSMEQFEKHAAANRISQDEVLRTYQQIDRLAQPGGANTLDNATRSQLIRDAMHGVAGGRVFQGGTAACNVSCVQDRTNALFPTESTKFLADVVQQGQYRAPDGTVVKVNIAEMNKTANVSAAEMAKNSTTSYVGDARDNLYERIWQTAAIDLNYAKENSLTGKDIHYEQRQIHPMGESGERLVDYSKHPPQETKFEGLNAVEIAQVSNMITGKNEKDVVLVSSNAYPEIAVGGPGVTVIHSEGELANKLTELKRNHKFPAIVDEYNATKPFYTEANSAVTPASLHWTSHVVTVENYDERTGQAFVRNTGARRGNEGESVGVHDLNVAMQLPKAAEKDVAAYVNTLRTESTKPGEAQQTVKSSEQFVNEVQLLRLRVSNEEMSDAQAGQQLRAYIKEAAQRTATGRLSQKQSDAEIQEIDNTIGCLPPQAMVQSYRHEHQSGLIDDKEYFVKLAVLKGYVQGVRNNLPFLERWITLDGNNQAFYDELYRSYGELPPGMTVSNQEQLDIIARRHFNVW